MFIGDFVGCPRSGLYYIGGAGRKAGVLISGEPWILKFPRPGRELAGRQVPSFASSPRLGVALLARLCLARHSRPRDQARLQGGARRVRVPRLHLAGRQALRVRPAAERAGRLLGRAG